MLPRADEPLLGQLVLPAPDAREVGREVDELAAVLAHGPVDVLPAGERLPERGQDEVVVRVEDCEPDAVDPGGRAANRGDLRLAGEDDLLGVVDHLARARAGSTVISTICSTPGWPLAR